MAKKSDKAYLYDHLLRADQASGRVTRIYQKYVEEFTKLAAGLNIDPDKVFSFADYPQTAEALNKTLSKVARDVEVAIGRATREEWEESNIKNDALVDQLFKSTGIPKERLREFYNRNTSALEAFQGRKVEGLGLSDRIWKITEQYKGEMELGIDVALGEGRSAQKLSQDVRQLLRQPDNLFRRVRDKRGNLVLSQRAAAFHPGQGVYRSSFKNAMRVARSEVNMAYREADDQRWKELPFVVGYEVKLSERHPFPDICNDLAGKYPKDFKFRGWHPHCFCFCVSILPTDEEMDALQQKILNGDDISSFHSQNEVKDVPDGMREWITKNAERAQNWKSTPYFIRENFVEGDLSKGLTLDVRTHGKTKFKTPEEKTAILNEWNDRKATRHYVQSILSYMGGISDIDTSKLSTLLQGGDIKAILSEAKALAAQGKEILGLKNIDNPMEVARKFSAAEAKMVNEAVEKTFARWRWDEDLDSLRFLKNKLNFEIDIVTQKKKYATWEVARDAYAKRLKVIDYKIEKTILSDNLNSAIAFAKTSKSKEIKDLLKEWETLSAKDAPINELQEAAKKLKTAYTATPGISKIADDIQDFLSTPVAKKYNLTESDFTIIDNDRVSVSTNGYMALSEYHSADWRITCKYVQTSNSFVLNGKLDDVFNRGANKTIGNNFNLEGKDIFGSKMTAQDIEDIKAFDKIIAERTAPFDIDVVRMVDSKGIAAQFGLWDLKGEELFNALNGMIGKEVTSYRYLSVSVDQSKNVFTHRNVKWHSTIKKDTHCLVADNLSESEIVLGRGMKLTLQKVKYNKGKAQFEVWIDIVDPTI